MKREETSPEQGEVASAVSRKADDGGVVQEREKQSEQAGQPLSQLRKLADSSPYTGEPTRKCDRMDIRIGDILTMKKPHPCGSRDWQVLRIGADFKLRCCGCGHEVMGARSKFEKNVRQVRRETL